MSPATSRIVCLGDAQAALSQPGSDSALWRLAKAVGAPATAPLVPGECRWDPQLPRHYAGRTFNALLYCCSPFDSERFVRLVRSGAPLTFGVTSSFARDAPPGQLDVRIFYDR